MNDAAEEAACRVVDEISNIDIPFSVDKCESYMCEHWAEKAAVIIAAHTEGAVKAYALQFANDLVAQYQEGVAEGKRDLTARLASDTEQLDDMMDTQDGLVNLVNKQRDEIATLKAAVEQARRLNGALSDLHTSQSAERFHMMSAAYIGEMDNVLRLTSAAGGDNG